MEILRMPDSGTGTVSAGQSDGEEIMKTPGYASRCHEVVHTQCLDDDGEQEKAS